MTCLTSDVLDAIMEVMQKELPWKDDIHLNGEISMDNIEDAIVTAIVPVLEG